MTEKMKRNGVIFLSGQPNSGKTLLCIKMCEKVLKAEGSIWTLDKGHMARVLIRPRESCGFIGDPRKHERHPVEIYQSFLAKLSQPVNALTEEGIEQMGLLVCLLSDKNINVDFVLSEIRTTILKLQSKSHRYRLKDLAANLSANPHADIAFLGKKMEQLPERFCFLMESSPGQKIYAHAVHEESVARENEKYQTLALFNFMASIADLMKTHLQKPAPQLCIVDNLYRNMNVAPGVLRRLILNISRSVEKYNGLILVTTEQRKLPVPADQIIYLKEGDTYEIHHASGQSSELSEPCMAVEFLRGYKPVKKYRQYSSKSRKTKKLKKSVFGRLAHRLKKAKSNLGRKFVKIGL